MSLQIQMVIMVCRYSSSQILIFIKGETLWEEKGRTAVIVRDKFVKITPKGEIGMKDIRIISGRGIAPDLDTVSELLGCRPRTKHPSQTDVGELYNRLLPQIKMHIRPKAALAIFTSDDKKLLYVMLTLGEGISRFIEKQTAKEDMLLSVIADAMADSCLFAFEEQLLPMLRQICLAEGMGIAKRLEIPTDFPIEMQKKAYEVLDAKRTLGLSMTSGNMLDPVKSMCLLFELTEDVTKENLHHDCSKCENKTCRLRRKKELILKIEIAAEQKVKRILCTEGSNLLEVLQNNHISIPAYCGGSGICGKCGILVKEGELPITAGDRTIFSESELEKGMRLACRAVLRENISIVLNQQTESKFAALGSKDMERISVSRQNPYTSNDYGIAIDIGTTTLAFSLLKLQSGEILDTWTAVNSQRAFGADVISRLQAANKGKSEELSFCIQEDIFKGIQKLTDKNLKTSKQKVSHIAIAANTVMLHLLRGYSCEGFSGYPFAPVTLEPDELAFSELLKLPAEQKIPEFLSQETKVTLLPGISAFVGADITAGLYACEIEKQKETVLFLDLGTNGEMALKVKDKIYTASTAAGPAFEGGNIKWGMGSVPGAISQVTLLSGKPRVKTIGEQPPIGICGTGVIESTAELLTAGIIDTTGKLSEPYFSAGYPLAENGQGEAIVLAQSDIREIQMAKAAIRAGIEILCIHAGIRCGEIEKIYLAGGFGYFLNIKKAAALGIIPEELAVKTVPAGNTALKGALLFLEEQDLTALQKIVDSAEEIPLALDDKFEDLYLKYMNF